MTEHPDDTRPRSVQFLDRVRENLDRLSPEEAYREQQEGAIIVDVRTETHRGDGPHIPGALVIDLTVLPWRLDPDFAWSVPEAVSPEQRWILVCRHSYATSLAAWTLREMGLSRVTDVVGGFEAWHEAGLPTTMDPPDVRP